MNNTYSHAPRASRISSMLRRLAGVAIALAAGITVSGAAQAANAAWPQKPVSVVVPFPAGGSTDNKAEALARKFHALYGIGCTPAQRITRKSKGLANVVLAMYWSQDAEQVEWLLLATDGNGLEGEDLRTVEGKPRLSWLGYELVRHVAQGRTAWTWRRPRQEMTDLHALLASQASQRHYAALAETLERIARQPGFHGVRTQSWALFQAARGRGYAGPLPQLFYLQKVSHGERLGKRESNRS